MAMAMAMAVVGPLNALRFFTRYYRKPLYSKLPANSYFSRQRRFCSLVSATAISSGESVQVREFRKRLRIADIKGGPEQGLDRLGHSLVVKGWVRTVRAQSSVTFIDVNDGSCLSNMQCVMASDADGYDQVENGSVSTGASVWIEGTVVGSQGSKQKIELKVQKLVVTMCAWLPKYEAQVRRNFFKKCVDRMPDLLRTARNSGNRPFWILEDVWPKLIEYWSSEEFLKKSELGKAARASTRGGSLHTCGSISMGEHRRRLEGLKKRPVSQVEVFEETHMTKPKDGTQPRWIEPRAENTINAYNQIMEEFMLSQPKDDQGNPIQPSEEQIKDMWVRAAGVHKGKVYGLGSECISGSYTSRFSSASYMSQSSVNHEELEQMRRTIAELNEKYMQEKAAREEETRQKDVEFRRVTSDVQFLKDQLNSLVASGQFPLTRSPSSSDDE